MIYKDASIGNAINVAVVRIHVLSEREVIDLSLSFEFLIQMKWYSFTDTRHRLQLSRPHTASLLSLAETASHGSDRRERVVPRRSHPDHEEGLVSRTSIL